MSQERTVALTQRQTNFGYSRDVKMETPSMPIQQKFCLRKMENWRANVRGGKFETRAGRTGLGKMPVIGGAGLRFF